MEKRKLYGLLSLILILAIIAICTSQQPRAIIVGNTYYVSTAGNDANAGTSAAPFRTIQKAAGLARAGDIVNVLPGTYSEKITPANSGITEQPIVFQKYGASPVIIKTIDWVGIRIVGKNWITFDGFTVIGRGSSDFGIYIENGSNDVIKNCEISNVKTGIHLIGGSFGGAVYNVTASNNIISSNLIHDMVNTNNSGEREGIYVKTLMPNDVTVSYVQNTLVENNRVYGASEAFQNTGGTWVSGSIQYLVTSIPPTGTILRGNEFYNNACEQGTVSFAGDGLIENNFIHDNSGTAARCGLSLARGNMIVRNNIVVNTTASGNTYGNNAVIKLDDVTGEVMNNTIDKGNNNGISVIYSAAPKGSLKVAKNIIYEIVNKNLYTSGDMSKTIISDNWLINPLFVSSTDFHLQPNSPACGYGAYPCVAIATNTPFPVTATETRTSIPPSSTPIPPTKTPIATISPTATSMSIPPTFTASPCDSEYLPEICIYRMRP